MPQRAQQYVAPAAGRGGYYDTAGAMRDMVQNHMRQVLALTAMEAPAAFSAEAVRNEKVKALQAIRPLDPVAIDALTVRGQYDGYQQEPGMSAGSAAATTWPCGSRSTTGAGRACPSIWARARRCRSG